MEKNDLSFLEEIYHLNDGVQYENALSLSMKVIDEIDIGLLKRIGLKTYAKDKWTIHTIIQHLIDWERIWCFRAVIFARGEGSMLDGHDQEIMGFNSNANELTIEALLSELRLVRQSTIAMFNSFNKNMLAINCKFFEYDMPLHTIALAITAHQIHHFAIIQDRYWPLVTAT